MPYYGPDTPPPAAGVPQMPAAPNAGPAPVPYTGGEQQPEPPDYGLADIPRMMPGAEVMGGVSGNALQESGYAHDMNAGLVVPYQTAAIGPIYVGGDADAGGRDIVAATVAGAVAAREAWAAELSADTYGQGSKIGDLMTLPGTTATGAPLDPGIAPGITSPAGGFYDPPRNYGDAP